jgi:RNA polymerase sigma-70 factor (ECF subfamily)
MALVAPQATRRTACSSKALVDSSAINAKALRALAERPGAEAATARAQEAAARAAAHEAIRAEEQVLVARCRAGDRGAMRVVYERFRRRVHGLVSRIAGADDAEELTQEVFLKAFRGVDRFRGEAQLGTWFYRLAVNAALSHVARSKARFKAPDSLLEAIAAPTAPSLSDGDPRIRDRLSTALSELPAGYRAVLVLHDVDGLQHEEIAEVLGCRVGTSKSQLHKARARMREILGPALAAERARSGGGAR